MHLYANVSLLARWKEVENGIYGFATIVWLGLYIHSCKLCYMCIYCKESIRKSKKILFYWCEKKRYGKDKIEREIFIDRVSLKRLISRKIQLKYMIQVEELQNVINIINRFNRFIAWNENRLYKCNLIHLTQLKVIQTAVYMIQPS